MRAATTQSLTSTTIDLLAADRAIMRGSDAAVSALRFVRYEVDEVVRATEASLIAGSGPGAMIYSSRMVGRGLDGM